MDFKIRNKSSNCGVFKRIEGLFVALKANVQPLPVFTNQGDKHRCHGEAGDPDLGAGKEYSPGTSSPPSS